jgi:hypothetical protein
MSEDKAAPEGGECLLGDAISILLHAEEASKLIPEGI